jgi:hypothetical protein
VQADLASLLHAPEKNQDYFPSYLQSEWLFFIIKSGSFSNILEWLLFKSSTIRVGPFRYLEWGVVSTASAAFICSLQQCCGANFLAVPHSKQLELF